MHSTAQTPPLTGAAVLVESLLAHGTEVVFGYPGGAIMPVYDALAQARRGLHHVLVRHEQGAVHAAQGYARTCGKVGVCLATSGPGATNLITGLADALMDSTAVICITGQVASHKLGTDAFQEADVMGLTLAATKWSYQITRADEVAEVLDRAFQIATSGRPGPVLIDITRDAQIGHVESLGVANRDIELMGVPNGASLGVPNCEVVWTYPQRVANLSGLEAAARLINDAQRPYMLLGHGVTLSGAKAQALKVAELTGMPVAATLLGLAAFDCDHPQYVGMLGMHGNYAPNMLTNEADVILAVGLRFDDRVTGRVEDYARQAQIIHIDIDPAEVNRQVPAAVALIGDARAVLTELTPLLKSRDHSAWLNHFQDLATIERRLVTEPQSSGLSCQLQMGEVVDTLSELTAGDAVLVSDVGQHQMMAARHYRFTTRARHITSGGLGTMGFALPAALGACLAQPTHPVVAVIGDGGFQMTLQELGTVMQEQLAVKMMILNNSYLGMVRQWQELFFDGRESHVSIASPNFVTLAASYGIESMRVQDRASLRPAIARMLEWDGPFLLDVVVENTGNVFPMIPAGAAVNEIRLS